MNFKDSDYLLTVVAFLVGYFMNEISNGNSLVEGKSVSTSRPSVRASIDQLNAMYTELSSDVGEHGDILAALSCSVKSSDNVDDPLTCTISKKF